MTGSTGRLIRVAILRDYLEEGWTSMDLVGSMIATHLNQLFPGEVEAVEVIPPYRPRLGSSRLGRNADRMLHRHLAYPRLVRRLVKTGRFDLFHVVDHSYAHLVQALPRSRAVVTCHDLDAFRCLLSPGEEPRPAWFRWLARRTWRGLQQAAGIAADSQSTLRGLVDEGIFDEFRIRVIHLGIHPECSPDPDPVADAEAARLLGPALGPELLHVGSNIPRKRVDVALGTLAGVVRTHTLARMVKVGGALPEPLARLADELGLTDRIITLPPFSPTSSRDRATLASVYRRASVVLQPSTNEGFGLPVAEALACGAPVVASDLPVLREVAGRAAVYREVGDVAGWVEGVCGVLAASPFEQKSRREAGLVQARRYGWARHVEALVEVYREVLSKV